MPSWFPIKRLPIRRPQQMLRIAAWLCLGVLLALAVLLAVPSLLTLFGYRVYVVYGGSMGSSLPAGSIGVTKTVDSQALNVGDIVAMKKSGRALPVLHRIVDIETVDGTTMYTTRGDKNGHPDPEPVSLEGSGDKLVFAIPYLGYLVHFARGTLGRVLLLLVPSLLLLGLALRQAILHFVAGDSNGRDTAHITQADGGSYLDPASPFSEAWGGPELTLPETWGGLELTLPETSNESQLTLLDALDDPELPFPEMSGGGDDFTIPYSSHSAASPHGTLRWALILLMPAILLLGLALRQSWRPRSQRVHASEGSRC